MKKIIFAMVMMAILPQIYSQSVVNCKIKGSDTCLPLTQKEAEVFMKKNSGSSLMVTGGGSGVGFAALQNGTTDIAQASRSMKMDEKMKMNDAGKSFIETIIAYDALAVIVNPANKINQLTREQLESIFTGKVTNWKDVGGDDMPIVLYSRESSSGTFEFFKEHVLNAKNFATSAMLMPATGAIVQSVSQTKGAIGYIGLAYLEKTVKALKVSYDQGKTFITPSMENAINKSYPITRPLYYYYLKTTEKAVKPYVDFVLSPEGQVIVKEVGYVPVPAK
jgi:phosphate transport system substrate-binding protein